MTPEQEVTRRAARKIADKKRRPERRRQPETPTCSGCGYCDPASDRVQDHCHKCCDLGVPF